MTIVPVELLDRSYEIEIEGNSLERIGAAVDSFGNIAHAILVVDSQIDDLYTQPIVDSIASRGINVDIIVVPSGEESKSIEMAYSLWEKLLSLKADRNTLAVALGGGVIGDLTGFVAATYMRGIRFYQVPTTLLAQVDSSIGGKTAIDLPRGKNTVGAFHQPIGVLIDPNVLSTLSDEQYRSGLGEVLKYAVSLDVDLFKFLENNVAQINERDSKTLETIIAKCCNIKAQIVKDDERETSGKRALLNFGHTFGHALEAALGYGVLPHGLGVSIGSVLAGKLASYFSAQGDSRFSEITDEWLSRFTTLQKNLFLPRTLKDIGLDYESNPLCAPENLVSLMKTDKKAQNGLINVILPTSLGSCVCVKNISKETLLKILEENL